MVQPPFDAYSPSRDGVEKRVCLRSEMPKIRVENRDPIICCQIQPPEPVERHGPDAPLIAEIRLQRRADPFLPCRYLLSEDGKIDQLPVRLLLYSRDKLPIPYHPG